MMNWIKTHFAALLYGWFWIGLALSGYFAPTDRVLALESNLVSEGWHLSVLALCFGMVTMGLYGWRIRASRSG